MEKILIIRLSSIGDILQCSGVPRVLRKKFPQAQIHWLVRSDNKDLLEQNPHLNKVISFDRKLGFSGLRKLAQELREQNYTHVYDAHSNLRSHYLSAKLKPDSFIRRHKPRFKRFALFYLRLNLFKRYNSASSFIEPLRPWGVENDAQGTELHLSKDALSKAKTLLDGFGTSQSKWIAFIPSAAWAKKRWPTNHFVQLAQDLLQDSQVHIAILAGPEDTFCKEIEKVNPKRILNLQGRLSLLESAAVASLCRTTVGNDTGLLHMAEALGRGVVELVGPTPFGDPTRRESIKLENKLWCKPCSKDGRGPCINPTYQKCLVEIAPAAVAQASRKFL